MSNCSVCVTADSTCDLSSELLSQYGIDTLPLYVVMEGKAYKDGVEITPDDIYAKVKATGKIGSTAAINVDESGLTWVPPTMFTVYGDYINEIRDAVAAAQAKLDLLTPEQQQRVQFQLSTWTYVEAVM